MIDIRHRLNDHLMKFGGHIGYSVIKSQRRKGIATTMPYLALLEGKKLNVSKVLITCDKENIASAKTINKNKAIQEVVIFEWLNKLYNEWSIINENRTYCPLC